MKDMLIFLIGVTVGLAFEIYVGATLKRWEISLRDIARQLEDLTARLEAQIKKV
jgi:hypothetical protein